MSLKYKLILFCLAISILPLAVTAVVSMRQAGSILGEQAFAGLEAARDSRKQALEAAAATWLREAAILAKVKEVYNGVGMLRDYFMLGKPGVRVETATDEYKDLGDYVAPPFAPFTEVLGFEDALVVADDGRVYYGAKGGREVGEDLKAGPLKDSSLAAAWKGAMAGKITFADFAPYAPLGGEPAAFVAAPIKNHVGTMIEAAAVLRVPRAELARIMGQGEASGMSREFVLVGADGGVRVASTQGLSAISGVSAETAQKALAGQTGDASGPGESGQEALAAYAPVVFGETPFALVARTPAEEAFAAARGLRHVSLAVAGVTAGLVLLAVTLFLRKEILKPLAGILDYLAAVTHGDFAAAPPARFRGEMERLRQGC